MTEELMNPLVVKLQKEAEKLSEQTGKNISEYIGPINQLATTGVNNLPPELAQAIPRQTLLRAQGATVGFSWNGKKYPTPLWLKDLANMISAAVAAFSALVLFQHTNGFTILPELWVIKITPIAGMIPYGIKWISNRFGWKLDETKTQ